MKDGFSEYSLEKNKPPNLHPNILSCPLFMDSNHTP